LAALLASQDTLLTYLRKKADYLDKEGFIDGNASGSDVGAVILIQKIAEAIANQPNAQTVFERLAKTPVPSLEQLAAYMVGDCILFGFTEQLHAVLEDVLRQGNGLVDGAREGFHPDGHPEMMLDRYYFALMGAAPYLRAAMIGYGGAALEPNLSEAVRNTFATRANAAEEKLVRLSDAMLFAVKDLDGSESRIRRAEIQKALADGNEDRALGLAMELVDLKLFYPKPFKDVLLRRETKS
jgi:hypothetical protein